ncbi:hypothetical protein [Kitasatospora sp. NPDC057541]|uniref:hypothetical protein n=1 Tax=Kitasatospora sp. NPDC057541 TaxID=3346161 RepID=UPI0036C8E24D
MTATALAQPDPDPDDVGRPGDHHRQELLGEAPCEPGNGTFATSTGTSASTSTPPEPESDVCAGQTPRTRGSSRGDNPLALAVEDSKSTPWRRGSTAPVRGRVLMALALF